MAPTGNGDELVGHARRIERLCLGGSARKSVENKPLGTIFTPDALGNESDHKIIRNQIAGFHNRFCLFP